MKDPSVVFTVTEYILKWIAKRLTSTKPKIPKLKKDKSKSTQELMEENKELNEELDALRVRGATTGRIPSTGGPNESNRPN